MVHHNSVAAYDMAVAACASDVRLLASAPVLVRLQTLDDAREVAYLVLDLRYLTAEEATRRICRWLRAREVVAA